MLPNRYRLNENNVWLPNEPGRFNYSDGDEIEQRLLEDLCSASDVSLASDELQKLIKDWPSEYHFSPLRSNLLSSFNFASIDSVLEIGSGCGAITRFLGEKCTQVLALEGSSRRAAITRERCRDLDNVTVCCDTFEDFSIESKFDCVTLIGVLEYSPSFMQGDHPVESMLQRAYELLGENGVLVVGIENQLGLKYFNGCSEDHSGYPFTGINDDYHGKGFCTLGRRELARYLACTGFNNTEWFFPFPDYKLPRLLARDNAFEHDDLNVSQIIAGYLSRDYTGNDARLFHETRVWPLLGRNGIVKDLSNSFLTFSFKGQPDKNLLMTDDWLIQTYSCPRKKAYLTRNVFKEEGDGISVIKQKLYPEVSAETISEKPKVIHSCGLERFYTGKPYSADLRSVLQSDDTLRSYNDYLTPWVQYLFDHALTTKSSEKHERLHRVSGKFLDCIPANLIVTGNSPAAFALIDQEWEYESGLDIGFVIFRGIYRDVVHNLPEFEETALLSNRSLYDLIAYVFDRHDLVFNQEIMTRYVELEVEIQQFLIIHTSSFREIVDYLSGIISLKRHREDSLGHFLKSRGLAGIVPLEHDLRMLREDNCKFAAKSEMLREELHGVKGTWSWKIGRFITGLFRFSFRKS